ncbi:Uncharacterised protein [Streptococcus constellatus]|uniref:Uncharacterized protein n=1 Tax=Streptococcus constellatus TaxID=76860 RepID=A0A564TSX2_STRCV|nr:hypothetical protein [Streptococcus constellatus]VUW99790.1 Uncharacterised protein [Streptococcus gordonii]VUX10357.1 Uncharacterised protein [Streptococcus constellatus]
MKLSNLLLFTGVAAASFCLVKNREKVINEAIESYDLIDNIQHDLQNIQKNLQVIQAQKGNLETITQDLSYQFRLFEQEATARLRQIQDVWNAHQK